MPTISLGWNGVPKSAEEAIVSVMRSGQYSPGARVREWEKAWADLHGGKHAVFVNSGTDALRISLLALKEKYGWPDGARVGVPAVTFVATVNVIEQARLRPFFVDVSMNDYTMNPDNLIRRTGTGSAVKLAAIMPVHLFGQRCDPRLFEWARERNVKVLEDSCETVLNKLQGEVSCYSTYMAHHVTTGVGGLAVTNDEELNLLMRSYANHGRDAGYLPGYRRVGGVENLLKKRFRFERIGYSSRGTEFEAVLGLSQLEGLAENVEKRCGVSEQLQEALKGFEALHLPRAVREHTWMMYPILLRMNSGIDKYDLCLALEEAGIETREMMPITTQPCYRKWFEGASFSVADEINRCGFYIPCHPGMTEKDVAWIRRSFDLYLTKKRIGGISVVA